ncbi:MAG: SDR family NAD(P)-dependent oxidoreductase [Actinophytocola sp.]|uniref:SDR family NAD(P)-dependent oxidoreductase n=1 Tax=Actinophytocola sp. TaxID=1872138 RepID=UPI001322CA06|nr:SDR family NAD(P)-dependent oxidoreductase [Actinophytocola sp.]MPZ82131.1 SDR family NAD(P)-dependent oxidoreductase [Actinophytocola sp.]
MPPVVPKSTGTTNARPRADGSTDTVARLAATIVGRRFRSCPVRRRAVPMSTQPRSADRTVVVTGASSGIGRATARGFAGRSWRVFGTSRRDRPDEHGVTMLRLDVRSQDSVASCVDEVLRRAGRIDVLVNNAGVMHSGIAEETTQAEARAVFDVNFFGTVRVTAAVLPGMRARGRGHIINVGSLAAWIGEPGEAYYPASKAALARYTEALRHEVRHRGVAVCSVEPGAFVTDVVDASSNTAATIADYDGLRERARETLNRSLRGGGDPRKVADLIVRIAGTRRPRARYGVGPEALLVPRLTTLLPQRLVEHLLRRGYRLDKG